MNQSCINISDGIRIAVGTVGVVSCSFSILGCFCAIGIIIIYKKYVFSIQRLFLYLAISVIINTLGQLVQRVLLLRHSLSDIQCDISAFVTEYSVLSIILTFCCVMFELLVGIFYSFETGMKANIVYLILIFIVPGLVSWVPFTVKAYGQVFWFCDIMTHHNDENCSNFKEGVIVISFLWWIPLYSTLTYLIIGYIILTAKLLYDRKRYTAMIELDRNKVYRNTYNDIMYLKYYPIIYMAVNILPIASSLYDYRHHTKPLSALWIASAFIRGFQGGVVTLAAVIDPKTRKRLTYKQIKVAFLYNVLRRDAAEEYPIINEAISDSLLPNQNTPIKS